MRDTSGGSVVPLFRAQKLQPSRDGCTINIGSSGQDSQSISKASVQVGLLAEKIRPATAASTGCRPARD
jgi:hypothetical protein